jgi:PiT family inorganic phosphate transporter
MLLETLVGLVFALYLAVSIGANDETQAPLAGSGAMSLGSAVVAGAVAAFLGAILLGKHVENTIANKILTNSLSMGEILLVLGCIAIFLTSTSLLGLSVSTTHSTVGAIIGLGVSKWGLGGVSGSTVLWVSIGWLASPIIGLIGAYLLDRLFNWAKRRRVMGLVKDLRVSRWSAYLLFFWVFLTEFARSGNDIANVTGLLVQLGLAEPFKVRLIAALGMSIGLFAFARRVIRTVGVSLVKIDPVSGLAAQIVMALTMLGGTLLGLPLSGSHVLVGAIIGLGIGEGRYVDLRKLRVITIGWIATFVCTFLMSYLGYRLLF